MSIATDVRAVVLQDLRATIRRIDTDNPLRASVDVVFDSLCQCSVEHLNDTLVKMDQEMERGVERVDGTHEIVVACTQAALRFLSLSSSK